MKVLTDRAHQYLDWLVVAYLVLAPTMFGFTGRPAAVFYVVAMVQLASTLAATYRVIRFGSHGAVEAIVAASLVAMPWLARYHADAAARNTSIATGMGIAIFALLTDYRHVQFPIYLRALAEEPDTENPSSDRLPEPRSSRPSLG